MAPDTRSTKQKEDDRVRQLENARVRAVVAAHFAEMQQKSGASSPNSGEDEHYDAVMVNEIYICVKTKLWRGVKFVANGAEEEKVAIKCFEVMKPKNWTEKEWVKEYRAQVTKSVNKCRSYVIGELKKEAFNYMAKNEGNLPTLDQMLKIAERTVTSMADQLVFEWYWDEYLPKCTGNIWDWSKDKRHFETIRASKDPVDDKFHMSVSNEAFALIVFENNRGNWLEIYAKQKETGKTVVVKAKVLSAEEAKNDDPKNFYTIDAKYKPQWSSASKGQQKYGGWSGVGLNKFLQYRTIVQEARKVARANTLEKKVLKAVRKRHKIPEDRTLEDHLASKKRKRTKKERAEEDIVETIEIDEE